MSRWYVYILECADGSYYTGITNNLEQRLSDHNTGKGAKYTRYKRPVKLVYKEVYHDKSTANKREIQIKDLSRGKKKELIKNI